MLKLNKRYRSEYENETIVIERVYEAGQWTSTTETVPNSVTNNQISDQAVVYGNGLSRVPFNTDLITNHKGGLLGAKTLQTYGCNAIYRDIKVDFLISTDRAITAEIASSGYYVNNIVYTRVQNTLEFPKLFYLIPNDIYADAGTTAIYIAAFDGHKKIFLLGFDGQDTPGFNHNIYAGTNAYDAKNATISDEKWIANRTEVFSVYDDVDFVLVTETGRTIVPEPWKYLTNVRQISFQNFITEVSL